MILETPFETPRKAPCQDRRNVLESLTGPLAGIGRQTGLKIRSFFGQNQRSALKQSAGQTANASGMLKRPTATSETSNAPGE